MRIGCPKEIKAQECRVGLTPAGVDALVRAGHEVYMEDCAGVASGFPNEEYVAQGAKILPTAKEVYDIADMIVKVKEPLEPEYELMHEGQIMFTYLHLAPDPEQTQALLRKKVTGIAYETVQLADRSLPLLSPMSEVAGRLSIQVGSRLLESNCGGRGVLLGGVTGVERANVVIVGGGNVGTNNATSQITIGGDAVIQNGYANRGGNVAVHSEPNNGLTIDGGTFAKSDADGGTIEHRNITSKGGIFAARDSSFGGYTRLDGVICAGYFKALFGVEKGTLLFARRRYRHNEAIVELSGSAYEVEMTQCHRVKSAGIDCCSLCHNGDIIP